MAQQVDLAQAHGVEKVADRCGVFRDARSRRGWIGIPKAGQIGSENRAPGPRDGQETLEGAPGKRTRMHAEQGSPLLEATARRDGIVDVQLPVAAFEIAPADARACWRFPRGRTA